MKRNRTTAIVYYIFAVVFYIVAIINIFDKTMRGMGVTWLCLGSMWLCLGTVYFRKSQDKDDNQDSDDEQKKYQFIAGTLLKKGDQYERHNTRQKHYVIRDGGTGR